MKETEELIKKVEETLSETSKEENRFKIIFFYNDHFHSINSIMNLLKEVIDNKDANLITPYKNSLNENLMSFKDESSEIKESNETIKKLDLQISKCDQL